MGALLGKSGQGEREGRDMTFQPIREQLLPLVERPLLKGKERT